jgi:diguanylate cyclase (GGDEF)-like protein/PAS domain S-box-containing protein
MNLSRVSSLQQLVDGMLVFVGIFSRDGRLLEANQSALAAGDVAPEQVYGKHVDDIEALSHSAESRAQVNSLLQRAAAGHTVREDLRVRLAGGRLAEIDTLFIPLFDAAGGVEQIGAVGIEVTAQKHAADALLRLSRQLRVLSSCNHVVLRTASEPELLQQICAVIVTEGGYRFAWVGLAEPGDAHRVRPAAWAGVGRDYLDQLQITWDDSPTGRGPTGRAIRQHSVEICRDISADPAFDPWRDHALGLGYVCSVALPIMIGGACIGALNIYSDRRVDFDAAEIGLLTELTNDLAYGMAAMRTREERQRLQSQLQMFRRLLDRTDDMIYVVDAATGRVVDANEAVSRQLGYAREELLAMHLTDFSVTAREQPWAERVAQIESAGSLVLEGEHRRRNGTTFPVEVSLSYAVQEQTRYLISVTRDLSRQKRQQALIENMGRVLRMQSAVNAAVLRIQDRDELLREACRLATQLGGYDRAVVSMVDPDGRCARPRFRTGAAVDFPEPDALPISDGTGPDTSLSSRALRTGMIAVCNDLTRSEPPVAMSARLVELGFKTVVALPLIVEGRRIGVITLSSRHPAPIGDRELLLLEEMTANLSFALRTQAQATAVQFLASYDSLTGLANRSLFCKRLDDTLARVSVPVMQPAVAAFDIHHLGSINDAFGRHFGDRLLQEVAERLRRGAMRDEDVGYVGGGTFVIVEPELFTSEGTVNTMLEATVFKDTFSIDGREIQVSCRSGVARAPADGRDAATLLRNAEAALKRAKEMGEQYLHYRLEMHSEIAERLALEIRLRNAIDARQFVLHYQPQVSISTGRIEAVEALLRWNDPGRGLVLPARFLPVLESSGLIVAVGEWALRQAVEDCRRWAGLGLGPVRIGVNVSPLQLRRHNFVEQVLRVAGSVSQEYPGYGIDLEITETALLQDVAGASAKLRQLRAAGIRIALDDFGTGYSSLGLLSQLPVDILKIDRSFVAGLPHARASIMLADTIISLAQAFDLITVGEGVETAEQLAVLERLHCNLSQGFLHSPGLPTDELERMLRAPVRTSMPGGTPGT